MKRLSWVRICVVVVGLVALAALMYWLLPVAVQSRLSADHVRYVFGLTDDRSPTVGGSLSSPWILLLEIAKFLKLGADGQTFATIAALSGWIGIATLVVLSVYVPSLAIVLVALSPAMLWTSVVPNGFVLSIFFLALMGLQIDMIGISKSTRSRKIVAGVIDGLACSMNPFAWILLILRTWRRGETRSAFIFWLVFWAVGFTLPLSIGILLEATSGQKDGFSGLPIVSLLRSISLDDTLGAARVIVGRGGEVGLALVASLTVFIAILFSPRWMALWSSSAKPQRIQRYGVFGIGIVFFVFAGCGKPAAWRLAHPGWNTVLEDVAINIEKSFSMSRGIALMPSSTEEAAVRYVQSLRLKKSKLTAVHPDNLFEPTTIQRIKNHTPEFRLPEFKNLEQRSLVEDVIVPNTAAGVNFWTSALPDRTKGFEIQFLANGFRISGSGQENDGIEKPTHFVLDPTALQTAFVRSRLSIEEFKAGRCAEIDAYERNAAFHLGRARVIEREKKTSDWLQRARAEYFTALNKVEWLQEPYQKSCVAVQNDPGEPFEVCVRLRAYYESR